MSEQHSHHHHENQHTCYPAAVITVSDKGARGERKDTSGPALCSILQDAGYTVLYTSIVPDDKEQIMSELISCADEKGAALVLTTGGTGFSPRDITPEATLAVIERETRGIPELMRAESCKITPRGCLSRAVAGIRGRTLIINLPGSEKAALENLHAVLDSLPHGLDMLYSAGSADCGQPVQADTEGRKKAPSADEWLKEAKADASAKECGMYLFHNGTVRETARAAVREGASGTLPVTGMLFDYDEARVQAALEETLRMEGIHYARVWLNRGICKVGDDLMLVLVGGDIRPNAVNALNYLVGRLKSECVTEKELFD